jgi:hypothetical protein
MRIVVGRRPDGGVADRGIFAGARLTSLGSCALLTPLSAIIQSYSSFRICEMVDGSRWRMIGAAIVGQ